MVAITRLSAASAVIVRSLTSKHKRLSMASTLSRMTHRGLNGIGCYEHALSDFVVFTVGLISARERQTMRNEGDAVSKVDAP